MGEILSEFGKKFTQLGPHLTFLLMLFIVIFYFFKDSLKKKIEEFSIPGAKPEEKKEVFPKPSTMVTLEVEKLTFSDLMDHDVFNVIEEVRAHLKFYEFKEDETKTKVFQDFMEIMLDEISTNLSTLLHEIEDIDNTHNPKRDALKKVIMDRLNFIVKTYCSKAETHFIKRGFEIAEAEFVVALFEEWRSETRESINRRVNAIFASSFHQTNFARTLAVYELISVSVGLIPKDGIRSFETMNGRLKNIKYKSHDY
jgi:hypothetical protein